MYRVAYMYVPPPPPRRTRSCLVPPGCQRVNSQMPHRRQPVEGIEEATDQVTALKASDQDTEGILLSTQVVCIVTYVIRCASNLHSCLLLLSVQVTCIVTYVVIVSSVQVVCIVVIVSSVQVVCIVGSLSSMQRDYTHCCLLSRLVVSMCAICLRFNTYVIFFIQCRMIPR